MFFRLDMPLFKLSILSSTKNKDKKDSAITEEKTPSPAPETPEIKDTAKKIVPKETAEETPRKVAVPVKPVSENPMVKIVENTKTPPEKGDLVEGTVIVIDKSSLFVDLAPYGTGIIFGREFLNARDIIKKTAIGDTIAAKVVERENEEGYVELSLKEARQALVWSEAEGTIKDKSIFELMVKDANKGGLMLEWQGIVGFLPASQLKAEHYPRVEGGSKERVLEELKKFVGKKLAVSILSASPREGKLIFSEKEPEKKERSEIVEKYSVGDVVEGEITGIVDFGLFVKVEDRLEGLVHISEMDWGLVENPRMLFKVGEHVKAQVIEIKDGKISLSIKALKKNPWTEGEKKYKKGDIVTGVVIKYNKHGALMSIEEGIAGLVHISEFENEKNLRETLELGRPYEVMITFFDPKNQRMTLSHKDVLKKKEEVKVEKEEVKIEAEKKEEK